MKAKFGSLIVGGSGKIGGHVVTKNRQGYALRTKVTPINRRSAAQTLQRQNFTGQSQEWRTLTDAQRSAWDSFASNIAKSNIWGDKYSPTGKNAFQLVNMNLLLVGGTPVSDPPLDTPATALTAFAVASNTDAAQTLSFAATPVPAGMQIVLFATRPLSAGVSSAGQRFRKFSSVAAAATSPKNSYADYVTKFGVPVVGKKIFFQAKVINITTGQVATGAIVSSITA